MKILACLAFILVFININGFAQFGYGKVSEIEALQQRKLLVIIEQPNARVLKKLDKKKKTDQISTYKTAVDEYNSTMKKVAEKFWTFSKNGIEYKTFQQADSLRKSNDQNYAVLYCVSASMSDFNSGFNEDDGLDWTWDVKDDSKDRDYFDGFTEMKVSTLEDLKKKPIFYIVLTDIFPTTASLVNGITGLQTYMDLRLRSKRDNEDISANSFLKESVTQNNKELKTKTLLIREDLLAKNYDKNKIAESYPYKFEIVSSEKLDSVVFNQDPNYLYAFVLPGVNSGTRTNQVYYMQQIIDPASNNICAYSKPSMGSAILGSSFGAHTLGHRYIDNKTLEDFVNPK